MRGLRRRALTLAAATFAATTIGLAVPAKATPVAETHCPHEISVREVVCFVCTIAIPILEDVTGRDWQCTA
ncbi:MAG: hypothetical protein M3279_12860, partial [Actinomycetota bacterium]|nr:hypothetical protein [Actinomycetota bacterium]